MSKRKQQYIDVVNDFTEEEEAVFKPTAVAAPEPTPAPTAKSESEVYISLDTKVAAQYRGGMSIKDITRVNEISAGKIYGILARKGVTLRSGRYNTTSGDRLATMTNKEKQTVIDRYLNGAPLVTLYEDHSLNKHGLYRVLDEANIPRRHKHISTEAAPEEKAASKGLSVADFEGTRLLGVIAEAAPKQPTIADISRTDTGLHITLNKSYLTSMDTINITISVV